MSKSTVLDPHGCTHSFGNFFFVSLDSLLQRWLAHTHRCSAITCSVLHGPRMMTKRMRRCEDVTRGLRQTTATTIQAGSPQRQRQDPHPSIQTVADLTSSQGGGRPGRGDDSMTLTKDEGTYGCIDDDGEHYHVQYRRPRAACTRWCFCPYHRSPASTSVHDCPYHTMA